MEQPFLFRISSFLKLQEAHIITFQVLSLLKDMLRHLGGKDSVFFAGTTLGYTEGSPLFNSFYESGGEVLFAQGRGVSLNRGFSPGSLYGRRMFNGNLEYRFPIARIGRGMDLMPFHLKVIHAALVADVTSMDFGPSSYNSLTGTKNPTNVFKIFYTSAGLELKSDWKFFYYVPTVLRAGVYHGFGGFGSQDIQISFGIEASI